MIPAKAFYLIRHGESEANVKEFASGHIDVALTPLGIQQAEAARAVVEALNVPPSLIIHSHLQRARNTAAIINQNLKLRMIEDPMIAEQNFGDWEGQPWTFTRQPIRDAVDPPNGERHADFHQRVGSALSRFVTDHEGPVLIVCHGGVFRAIGALYNSQMLGVANCALHHFAPDAANDAFPWAITKFQ